MRLLRTRKLLLGMGVVWLLGAAMSPVHADNLKSIPADLMQIAKLRSIDIHDDWMGLSSIGPVSKHYQLKPEGNVFVGTATFSAGGGTKVQTKVENLSLPQEAVQSFLQALAASPIVQGPYQAKIDHTDDYPSQKIDIALDSETLSFSSQSQGEFAIPWALQLRGVGYVISAKNPAEALQKLKPYLKEDSYKKFIEEQQASAQGRHR